MAFIDVRLPVAISRDMSGGPRFLTSIQPNYAGVETRNQVRASARGEWSAGYSFSTARYAEVRAFYYAMRGAANSFRFKDWSDYEIADLDAGTYQAIGSGDGVTTDFQIYKRYSAGAQNYDRTITKIVEDRIKVYLDGVEQLAGWTITLTTGIVQFSVAPSGSPAPVVGVACEFDVPVRFAGDEFDVLMASDRVGNIPNFSLIEVIGE